MTTHDELTNDARVQRIVFELGTLRNEGILVDVEVRGTNMFNVRAEWEEFGIRGNDVRKNRFTPGTKSLIPAEQFKRLRSIEVRLRAITERYSHDVTGFRPYRWVPFTAYDKWREEWDRLAAEWSAARDEIATRRNEFARLLEADFRRIAAQIWSQVSAMGYSAFEARGGVFCTSEAELAQHLIDRALSQLPTSDDIRERLVVDYKVGVLVTETELRAQMLAEQADVERNRVELDEVRHHAHLEQLRRDSETNAEYARREAIIRAETEHARQQLAEMASPLSEVVNALRERIADDVNSILESVQKNGHVKGQVARKGAGLLEFYDLMAATGDRQLRDKLVALKNAIGPTATRTKTTPTRDVNEIITALRELQHITTERVADLTAGPDRMDLLEL